MKRTSWNKGKHHSEETKQKIREKAIGNKRWLGKKHTKEAKRKMSIAKKGKRISPETEFKKGRQNPNKGKPRLEMKGSLNPNWQGGLTLLQEQIRKSIQYQKWRIKIFKRDNYICQLCFKNSNKLNADHYPISFSSILAKFNILSIEEAFNCEILWDINNGRTLCVNCHKKTPNYLRRPPKYAKLD